jgi:hypothetical protein
MTMTAAAITQEAEPTPRDVRATNAEVASILERVATLLAAQGASPPRVHAWEHAAAHLRALDRDVSELVAREGLLGLDRLAGIGPSLAAAIDEIVRTRQLRFLAHLEGDLGDEALFATIPGIGAALARRIATTLHIRTLEELELAAHDGRLETIRGVGTRRARTVRDSLDVLLRGSARRRSMAVDRVPVAALLDIDGTYRDLAARDALPKIAPRRFNPNQAAWLPIMHVDRDGWHFTALYSNTARAHRLGKTHDWVVIYAERDGHEVQHTIVSETEGPLVRQRVVRGREREPLQSVAHA